MDNIFPTCGNIFHFTPKTSFLDETTIPGESGTLKKPPFLQKKSSFGTPGNNCGGSQKSMLHRGSRDFNHIVQIQLELIQM